MELCFLNKNKYWTLKKWQYTVHKTQSFIIKRKEEGNDKVQRMVKSCFYTFHVLMTSVILPHWQVLMYSLLNQHPIQVKNQGCHQCLNLLKDITNKTNISNSEKNIIKVHRVSSTCHTLLSQMMQMVTFTRGNWRSTLKRNIHILQSSIILQLNTIPGTRLDTLWQNVIADGYNK